MNSLLSTGPERGATQVSSKYLTFTLAEESFGVAIEQVREIIEYRRPTIVPMVPEYLRGVLNLRGAVVPVIDLTRRFGAAAGSIGRRTCIVIVELEGWEAGGGNRLGVMVDAVNAVLDLPPDSIEPPPNFGTHIHTDYLLGMGKLQDRFVLILNLQHILSEEELKVVQQTGMEAAALIEDGSHAAPSSPLPTAAPDSH